MQKKKKNQKVGKYFFIATYVFFPQYYSSRGLYSVYRISAAKSLKEGNLTGFIVITFM